MNQRDRLRRILSRVDPRRSLVIVVLALALIGAGVGGFVLGERSGVELEAAQELSDPLAERAGDAVGRAQGYLVGFAAARGDAFDAAYASFYRTALRRALARAGVDAPATISVRVPGRP